MIFNKYIGDRSFYKRVAAVAVPIMLQNGITNFVSLLDNIMVGQVGTEQMSGTAIANQLLFVFSIFVFGVLAGPGIYTAQFFGRGDNDGVRNTFRFKALLGIIVIAVGAAVLYFGRYELVSAFLTGESTAASRELTLKSGQDYLVIMLIGLIPFTVNQVYVSTLRETNKTVLPMLAGMAAVLVNLVLDWVLIFGKLGAPAMGVKGAAIATVIARFVECMTVIAWTYYHKSENQFVIGAFRQFTIPAELVKGMIIKGLPLAANEGLWSGGMAMLNQCYSRKGLDIVAATNISSTIFNLFGVVFIALGCSVGIIVGQILGTGDMQKAREEDTRLVAFTVAAGFVTGAVMAALSGVFPLLYNTSDEVRRLAAQFIMISGFLMPLGAFMHSAYFTLRSGGRTFITFLFDSFYVWAVTIPTALVLVSFTELDIVYIYFLCQAIDIIKVIVGYILLKKGIWLRNIVA